MLLLAATAGAEPLAVGSGLPELRLVDQHGEELAVDAATRRLVFSRDMDAGEIVKSALADDGALLLGRAGAVYVTDISRMPGLVTKLFALPAMKKRPYRIGLDRDGKATADLPATEGEVTVLALEGLSIVRVDRASSPEALRALLAAP